MGRATAHRSSPLMASRSCSIRIATATGRRGWSASTAATCERSRAPRAVYPVVSPNGDRVVFVALTGRVVYSAAIAPDRASTPTRLQGTETGGKYLTPTGWSSDGSRLIGTLASVSGRQSGVGLYDFATHSTKALSSDETSCVKWLADNRRVVYFLANGAGLVVIDTVTGQRSPVDVQLPAPPVINEMFTISPDNRTIYYGAARAEADIWIVEQK